MLQSTLGYKQYFIESVDEVKLYILLELIMDFQRTQDWIHEFDLAVQSGVNPRNGLRKMYKYINEKNDFPDYMISY